MSKESDVSFERCLGSLIMGHDTDNGMISFDKNEERQIAHWPFYGSQSAKALFHQVIEPLSGGKAVFPTEDLNMNVTAHPLGGVCMSDDVSAGVVDAYGRVYQGHSNDHHKGLYVADGSVIPSSLLVNPLLTISAVSEWIANHFLSDPENEQLF
jgi:cholesterol oxidase